MVLERIPISDERGWFDRFFCSEELFQAGIRKNIVQINRTLTRKKGTVRGMHFQHPPHTEMKIVSCLKGSIFDVAVDLRPDSKTFLQWHSEILTQDNHRSLVIPEGFAHGFQSLTENCELLYLHTAAYNPDSEGALNVLDPALGIKWPLIVDGISERDKKHPMLSSDFSGVDL